MLKVQSANSREQLDLMISNFVGEERYAVIEKDAASVKFPTKFIVMFDRKLEVATIEHLEF